MSLDSARALSYLHGPRARGSSDDGHGSATLPSTPLKSLLRDANHSGYSTEKLSVQLGCKEVYTISAGNTPYRSLRNRRPTSRQTAQPSSSSDSSHSLLPAPSESSNESSPTSSLTTHRGPETPHMTRFRRTAEPRGGTEE